MPEVKSKVAIFWDYENCALPAAESATSIVNNLRNIAHRYGALNTFKAYLESSERSSLKSLPLRSELVSCGVSLIDCPHDGRKDVADKMMIVDMLAYAMDNSTSATVILISGDRDFAYALSILRQRQYQVVVISPKAGHLSLKSQAEVVHNWPQDFLYDLRPSVDVGASRGRDRSNTPPRSRRSSPTGHLSYPSMVSVSPPPTPKLRSTTVRSQMQNPPERDAGHGHDPRGATSVDAFLFPETPFSPWGVKDDYDRRETVAARPSKPSTPPGFHVLVKILRREYAAGIRYVPGSQLGSLLSQERSLSSIYERAGVTRLKEYTALAEKHKLVIVGKEDRNGQNWIALHPAYYKKSVLD
ncbi:hypothetical protein A0H81_04566 [Grifola frondosa]|uniref:NYN domain-containing protein n=1 Tax=Grifola frondosa TaxID=5627 RepID=A0A1C7ME45_GRIFR|nr:hypothetical protein A0H81_04566 [Grifola frondosa]